MTFFEHCKHAEYTETLHYSTPRSIARSTASASGLLNQLCSWWVCGIGQLSVKERRGGRLARKEVESTDEMADDEITWS